MKERLDLLIVNPGNQKEVYGDLSLSLSGIEPPIWCAMLAAFIRDHGCSVKIIDADAENWAPEYVAEKIAEYSPLLVGIIVLGTNPSASSTPKMPAVRETIQALREKMPDLMILLGGLHPSALPERSLRKEGVDFVCEGEGFYTILKLLDTLKSEKRTDDYQIEGLWYIKDGKVISNLPAPLIKDLDELPFPAWDLLSMNKYRAHNWHCFEDLSSRDSYGVIYTSLGCPFRCSYCPIHAFYGKPGIQYRSPHKVVEEIDLLVKNYNIKNIKIMDELFVLREDRLVEFCDLIIQRGYRLNMWCYARVDTVNKNVLKKMKQAGINWVAYGFESASERVRQGVSKKIHQEKISEAIDMTYQAGINIMGNFIFGLPDDDYETMQETLNMAKDYNFEYVNFYTAMAYPGSQLYNYALEQRWPLPETWLGYAQLGYETLPLPTKYLSGPDVLRFRDRAFHEYFSNPKYLEKVRRKFGEEVERSIFDMLKKKLKRRYA
ncbi:MAG: radical SAM protein [bacterium]